MQKFCGSFPFRPETICSILQFWFLHKLCFMWLFLCFWPTFHWRTLQPLKFGLKKSKNASQSQHKQSWDLVVYLSDCPSDRAFWEYSHSSRLPPWGQAPCSRSSPSQNPPLQNKHLKSVISIQRVSIFTLENIIKQYLLCNFLLSWLKIRDKENHLVFLSFPVRFKATISINEPAAHLWSNYRKSLFI